MEDGVPQHIGFIVDGNRRWAKQHGLPAYEGHLAGYNALQDILTEALDQGVKYASAYVFSTENWKRSQDEVGRLMNLIVKILTADLHILQEKNVRLRVIGSRDGVSTKVLKAIDEAEEATKGNAGGTLALCFNYGGQVELTDAVRQIVASGVDAEAVTAELIAQNLYAPDIPPCDLIVRTSGEQRLSNFMLWRSAYSELLFLDKNWPDMTKQDVTDILTEYKRRGRRFGG
ncbi:di-trans,poly-cis-decaprenylcistransferase [Candidatus Saccharibacteria bacterium]|nr:di-trans,poly-cis-decaprenylcistransferase [Candidatus Saccharibacteria bacterium]